MISLVSSDVSSQALPSSLLELLGNAMIEVSFWDDNLIAETFNIERAPLKEKLQLTSTHADMELYRGFRFLPLVEWFADTKTSGESL